MEELVGKLREKAEEIRPWLRSVAVASDEGVYDYVLRDSCDSISWYANRMLEMLDTIGEDGEITPAIADDIRECAGMICDYVQYMRMGSDGYVGYDDIFVPWADFDGLYDLGDEIRKMLEPLRVPDDFTNERIAECWEACRADLLANGCSRVEDLHAPDRANPDKLDYVIRFDIKNRWQRDGLSLLEDDIEKFFSAWFGHRCITFMMPTYLLKEGYTEGFRYR